MPDQIDREDEELEALPQFKTPPNGTRTTDPPVDQSTPTSEAQRTIPTRPSHDGEKTDPGRKDTSSSPGSSKPDPELQQALEQFGSGVANLAGFVANKAHCKRARTLDDKWIMLDVEASTIGEALARIAGRQVPKELTEGDGGDLLAIGSVALGYTMRNLVGVSLDDIARFERGEMPIEAQAQEAPPPAQQAPPADPHSPPPAPSSDVAPPATQASPIIAQL